MPDSPVLEETIEAWVADPDGDVTYAERVGSRWAVRMRQSVRDATTVWWAAGDYSISAEAYVLPAPPGDPTAAYRLALVRNDRAWRAHFALDREGALVIRGRVPRDTVTGRELDLLLGEIYEMVEVTFRPLVAATFGRGRGGGIREKTS